MLGLTRRQLMLALFDEFKHDSSLITINSIQNLYKKYGDTYFCDHGAVTQWELCEENPIWIGNRQCDQHGIPKKGEILR